MSGIVVQDVNPRTQYVANAGQTQFIFPWLAFAPQDVITYYTPFNTTPSDVANKLTYNVGYTVTLNAPPSAGGMVTLTTPCNAGDIVTLVRDQLNQRLNYYIVGGLFDATMVNTDFDQEWLGIQQNTMYNTAVTPHYNLSASPDPVIDIYLPVLGPNQCWVMNSSRTAINAVNFNSGGGGGSGVTQVNTASPLFGGPITSTGTISLQTSGVVAGTYLSANVTVNSYGLITNISNGGEGAVSFPVNQTAHGFIVGTILKVASANTYAGAKADRLSNSEQVGIVSQVIDANNFILQTNGLATAFTGLTAGTTYYLDTATAGAFSATIPSVTGQVIKPIGTAVNANTMILTNMLGIVV